VSREETRQIGRSEIAEGVHVPEDCRIGSWTRIGSGVSLGRDVTIGDRITVHRDVRIGDSTQIGDGAVVGKVPTLATSSTLSKRVDGPTAIGKRSILGTGSVVFAGTTLGDDVLVGDGAIVRERCWVGPGSVVGAGCIVENDTRIGARCKVQAGAYVTAYTTLEDDVFIAPMVVTTNDNFMGRTEKRHAIKKGPTVRRGARIGAGAVLLPGIEVGEEAFVAAGSIVTRDVPPRTLVMGGPARPVRQVPAEQMLDHARGCMRARAENGSTEDPALRSQS